MGLSVVTPATATVVELADVRAWCAIEDTSQDTVLTIALAGAVGMVEQYLGRTLAQTVYLFAASRFCRTMPLPMGPVSAIGSVKYRDADGELQTVATSDYALDAVSDPQAVAFDPDASLPSPGDWVNPVQVTFTAGYAANGIPLPAPVKTAILMLANQWFENRSATNVGNIVNAMPMAVQSLLDPFRRMVL